MPAGGRAPSSDPGRASVAQWLWRQHLLKKSRSKNYTAQTLQGDAAPRPGKGGLKLPKAFSRRRRQPPQRGQWARQPGNKQATWTRPRAFLAASLLISPLELPFWFHGAEDVEPSMHFTCPLPTSSPSQGSTEPPQPSGLGCGSWEAGKKAVSPSGCIQLYFSACRQRQCPPPPTSAELRADPQSLLAALCPLRAVQQGKAASPQGVLPPSPQASASRALRGGCLQPHEVVHRHTAPQWGLREPFGQVQLVKGLRGQDAILTHGPRGAAGPG